jgi:intracellular sulfur oxidation DsrE/DsrF family protein
MNRPGLPAVLAVGLAAGLMVRGESGDHPSSSQDGASPMLRAVVHVNFADAERQGHGLKNVTNMLKEANGADEIVVVCHGGGIGLVVKDRSPEPAEVERLIQEGVRFVACENTLRDKAIPRNRLLPGVETVPSGAVEVVRRQQDGSGYFRP